MYQYVKTVKYRRKTGWPLVVSRILMVSGVFVLVWSVWPILSFFLIPQGRFGKIVSPVSEQHALRDNQNPARTLSPVAFSSSDTVVLGGETFGSTNPNLWFPASPQKKVVAQVNSYMLSIPRLKIRDATVIIAGDDLSRSLVHYGGTALPGTYGNTVIFGHSTLPQFYNPDNYTSIFSLLPTMKIGDEIFVTYDGITYRYSVIDMTVTKPNDLSPLEQHFDDSYVTLITCVPPGTYWMRLNVKARLAKI